MSLSLIRARTACSLRRSSCVSSMRPRPCTSRSLDMESATTNCHGKPNEGQILQTVRWSPASQRTRPHLRGRWETEARTEPATEHRLAPLLAKMRATRWFEPRVTPWLVSGQWTTSHTSRPCPSFNRFVSFTTRLPVALPSRARHAVAS